MIMVLVWFLKRKEPVFVKIDKEFSLGAASRLINVVTKSRRKGLRCTNKY
jgi:hypothetical protein